MISDHIDRLRIIGSTNTQTRRLGYVVRICESLADRQVPMNVLQKHIEAWAEENNPALKRYVSDKGRLRRSSRSYGARRYIQLAEDLHLIAEVAGVFRPTATGRVLAALSNQSRGRNPFSLESKAILLLSYQLLLVDSDYLLPTLQLADAYNKQRQILENSQAQLIDRFRVMERNAGTAALRSEINERLLSVRRWTKPIKYAEHLVLPRLHWLLDLKLLNWNSFEALGEFEPSAAGASLVDQAPALDGHLFVNRSWCQNDMFPAWGRAFSMKTNSWSQVSVKRQESLTEYYVKIGFSLFRTMQYPRISAYQLVLFIVLQLLFENGIIAGFEDIKRALDQFSRSGKVQWNYAWFPLDDDGYLILSVR
jgi:hypothetical protein